MIMRMWLRLCFFYSPSGLHSFSFYHLKPNTVWTFIASRFEVPSGNGKKKRNPQSNDEIIRTKTFLYQWNRFRPKRILNTNKNRKKKNQNHFTATCKLHSNGIRITYLVRYGTSKIKTIRKKVNSNQNLLFCRHIHTLYGCTKTIRRFRATMHINKCVEFIFVFFLLFVFFSLSVGWRSVRISVFFSACNSFEHHHDFRVLSSAHTIQFGFVCSIQNTKVIRMFCTETQTEKVLQFHL